MKLTNFVDYSGGQAQAILSIAGTFGSGDILHMAGGLRGGEGNLQLTLTATTGNPVMTASNDWQPLRCLVRFQVITVINITCNAASTNTFCWAINDPGSKMFFETSASTCIPGSGGAFVINGAQVQLDVGTNIGTSGGGTTGSFFLVSTTGSMLLTGAVSIGILGSYTMTDATVDISDRSNLNFAASSFNLNGHTITGTRFACSFCSNIFGTSGAPNTFIPGSVNGTVGSACQAP